MLSLKNQPVNIVKTVRVSKYACQKSFAYFSAYLISLKLFPERVQEQGSQKDLITKHSN